MTHSTPRAVQELREQGYTVLAELYSPSEVEHIRACVLEVYEALGSPGTYARPPLEPAANVEVSVVGLVLHQLGYHCPQLADVLLKSRIVEVVQGLLGSGARHEYTAAVVNRGERPFFRWHNHIGGVDNIKYRRQELYPTFTSSERVTMLMYLQDLTPEVGRLLVFPRRLTDPTEPPFEPSDERWDGMAELACTAGSVVLMEQSTWHAALGMRNAGTRAFVASYFTAAHAEPTSWRDRAWDDAASAHSVLGSIL